jgi:hypothetical protein|tara:strand:- start:132 stop:419 length:288 start_codon:yes stop_codon:yes gene_type:complete
MKNTINYQQIYEEELSHVIRESLERPARFYELSHQDRMMVEELVDIGYRHAVEDALDPEVLSETAAMAGEMGTQLYNFANLLNAYLNEQNTEDES